MRIGIDVGGTHTDAVILDGDNVLAATKAPTSADVVSGIIEALETIIKDAAISKGAIQMVMIGTTQFTNAIVQRRELSKVAAIRIGLPSGKGLTPMVDWPEDIANAIGKHHYVLHGGYLYDGWPMADMDEDEIDDLVRDLVKKDLKNIAIASAFSPMNAQPETHVAQRILAAIPDARITLSNNLGRLGLLERENAAVLNATLLYFADHVVTSFVSALKQRGLHCPMFISQNDGTLMSADFVRKFPALTFASGPTNSIRGASKLTGLKDAIVVDIGGTTSDIGVLQGGFPRESNSIIEVGGVRTNFRMPDIMALGLGGGSLVSKEGNGIGPQSVGHRLTSEGLVFGGKTLTVTDIAVAAGYVTIGNNNATANINPRIVQNAIATMHNMLEQSIDMMRPGGTSIPIILVGGGAALLGDDFATTSKIYRPENAGVANAIGAAIAQIGGEAERMLSYSKISREDALAQVTKEATDKAISAGADPDTIRTSDIEETVVPYMAENSMRVQVKVIGDISIGKAN